MGIPSFLCFLFVECLLNSDWYCCLYFNYFPVFLFNKCLRTLYMSTAAALLLSPLCSPSLSISLQIHVLLKSILSHYPNTYIHVHVCITYWVHLALFVCTRVQCWPLGLGQFCERAYLKETKSPSVSKRWPHGALHLGVGLCVIPHPCWHVNQASTWVRAHGYTFLVICEIHCFTTDVLGTWIL